MGAEVFIPGGFKTGQSNATRTNVGQWIGDHPSGANVPFADEEIFYGPIAELADQNVQSSQISFQTAEWHEFLVI